MFLKNYTSDVPVNQTIYRIEQVLLKCGVSGIMKEYGVGQSVIWDGKQTFYKRVEESGFAGLIPEKTEAA